MTGRGKVRRVRSGKGASLYTLHFKVYVTPKLKKMFILELLKGTGITLTSNSVRAIANIDNL